MKYLIIFWLGLLSFRNEVKAQDFELTILVQNVQTSDGKVRAGLYDSEGTFLKEGVYVAGEAKEKEVAKLVFSGVAQGKYAVSVFHDENDNEELDTMVFGIPSEPFGFSNDATGSFGPPTFEDSSIEMNQDKTISITLN
ncbi:DUF2141 domain-containing protein [Reichenbachiella ulvae]|uniref:DUF2141 domain-containing protein n=1 Tax=Reichenbachiella ulvae TaxID=2980104 RepID=A0ABT3CPJ0_9BACT|nr:DUF2141 domain-containing protein [Reichenbachiella ulvae]MCV9385572.1 DUF2141 domain-containing protein [Reichenbachiella ulvae]